MLSWLLIFLVGVAAIAEEASVPEAKSNSEVTALLARLKSDSEEARLDAVYELVLLEDTRAILPLTAFLKEDLDWRDYEVVCGFLGSMKDPRAVAPLMEALENEDIRIFATMALGEIGDPRATDALMVILKDEAWEHRDAAVTALGEIGGARVVPSVVAALKDEDDIVQQAAALALAEIGLPEVVDPLVELVKNIRKQDVPPSVIETLGDLGDARASEVILTLLPSHYGLINWCALVALRTIEKPSSGTLDEKALEHVMTTFQESPPKAIDNLFQVLDQGNWATRKEAMKMLLIIGDPSILPRLEKSLEHKDSDVRMLAASGLALASEPGSNVSETLLEVFKSEDPALRRSALLGNTFRTDTAFLNLCVSALNDEDYVVRLIALRILNELDSPEFKETVEAGQAAEPEWIRAYIEKVTRDVPEEAH